MACFLAPMGEAIVMTVVQKVVKKKARKTGRVGSESTDSPWVRRLGWLNKMLWGGSVLLAFEHLWHGEIVPWPPFLTAMKNPADVGPMLHEIATVGAAMAVVVTAVWALMVLVAELRVRSVDRAGTTPSVGGAE
jgi:hypothetical protein